MTGLLTHHRLPNDHSSYLYTVMIPLGAFCSNQITADIPKLVRPELGLVRNRGVFGPRMAYHPATDPFDRWNCHSKINDSMSRIQRYAVAHGIRTGYFFKDFDTMNCGKITVEQFRRGLDGFGISGIHHLYLSEQEINDIINVYQDPNDPTRICWQVFENDVDLVFTTKNLERHPNLKISNPKPEVMVPVKSCVKDYANMDNGQRNLVELVMKRIRTKIMTQSLNIRDHFKDYDRLNNGHVTIPQFHQCLVYYGILCSQDEIDALEERYVDDIGFNYLWFLREAEPTPLEDPLYNKLVQERILLNSREILQSPTNKEKDIAAIMAKMKAKVVRDGIRVYDFFVDYDKLNKQVISEENFRRGLKLCEFKLSDTEVETVISIFTYPLQDGCVDYIRFCNAVESGCAVGGLERDPMLIPVKHVPPMDSDANFLNGEERDIVNKALLMLTQRCIYDPNLMDCFRDFDPACCGSVSRSHFFRVLALRKLTDNLSSKELDTLMKCFAVKRGSADEVDYRAFCKCLDTLLAISKRKPF